MSAAYGLGVVTAAESSEHLTQGASIWDLRRRHVPALQVRLPHRGEPDVGLRPSSTSTTRRSKCESGHSSSRTQQLLMSAYEDISRLNEILRPQRSTVLIRDLEGVVLPFESTAKPTQGGSGNARTVNLCSPIFDAEGCVFASLEVVREEASGEDSSEQLLRALLESAARAIAEKLFRIVHRHRWVTAAMRRNAPNTTILFATDRDQQIVGADRRARLLLKDRGQRMGPHLSISMLFRSNPTLLRRRSSCDISTMLFAAGDGEPWIALITPPDPGALASHPDARVLLHVRPRLDSLAHLSSLPTAARARRGLSQGALQRIDEHIAANLDTALDIDELAAIVRMSSSHFTRSFHKSVGVTPHRYVIQNRVMRARELLATTKLPLTEIALTTGFSDQSHFSRRFHEIVGIPPGAFRGTEGRSPA
jgi:AraC-like DNA-binding protein